MNFIETIASRQSIRQFTNQAVPQELLDEILETALLAPSSSNTQPYRIAVATGDVCAAISRDLTEKFQKTNALNGLPLPLKVAKGVLSGALPDGDIKPQSTYPPELHKRSVDCGRGFYETLGIERHDRDARDAQAQRNFEFFDAPVAIFVFIHKKMGHLGALDAGLFLQSLMLAATDKGLGTCTQGSLAMWGSPVRKRFEIEKDYHLICGLSLGYPDKEHTANQYRPTKRTLEELKSPLKQPE